jgi:two-component system LytT family sensor kinase
LALRPLSMFLDALAYASLAGITQAVHFYRRFRARARRALYLESHLARARLSALQAQLQPHFLFNTLNAIATLLRRDPRAAESTLTSLSDLLRITLSRSERQEIPLREELEFLERYVEIQRTRFGDRLRFELKVDDNVLDCLVPTLGLQSLVENAIRHGIEPSGKPGTVRVTAQADGKLLLLTVTDDGLGLPVPGSSNSKGGIGLSNLKARLETLYGAAQSFEMNSSPEGGVRVRLRVPVRPSHELGNEGREP